MIFFDEKSTFWRGPEKCHFGLKTGQNRAKNGQKRQKTVFCTPFFCFFELFSSRFEL